MKLVIVESPNKKKSISQFLGKDYVVEASVGHITRINDSGLYNCGINVKGDFEADFVIDDNKKDVVKHLKELVKKADEVFVCSDPDREGEAIAYHLKNELDIPAKKFKRATFHEITKKAVTEALANPRKLDMDLVNAALGRAKLDKIVGYRLSPISRNKIGARSVGRCQSAALKMIVEREEEILKFVSKTYYEIWLPFIKDKKEYKAQFKGLFSSKKGMSTIEDSDLAKEIVENCNKNKDNYIIHSIEASDRSVAPKPPFITSTLQQEVSSKLGYSVKRVTEIAQKLFEGINIGGVHVGLITYIRTDDTSLAPEFVDTLKGYVTNNYGKEYYVGLREKKKSKNAQEGHEAIRPVDLSMTPERLSSYINDSQLLKVYELIYNRTVASVMPNCIITDTNFNIKNDDYKFVYTEHAIKYDGFKKVYAIDDEELSQGLDAFTGEKLNTKDLELLEKHTNPPKRYSESTLIKKLEDAGIGRPSTYASIISIILDPKRNYCQEEGKSLAPTEKGIQLSHFLDEAFPKIINYEYSAKLEESLDLIAHGKLNEVDFLKQFYSELEEMIKGAKVVAVEKPKVEEYNDHVCPNCGKQLLIRNGRFGKFIACSGWPKCKYTEKLEP